MWGKSLEYRLVARSGALSWSMGGGRLDTESVARLVASELGVERLARRLCDTPRGAVEAGLLVAVEGIDGAGVTTISRILVGVFESLAGRAVYTKEPTGSPIGSLIRLILGGYVEKVRAPEALAHLFVADRVHHFYEYEVVSGARGVAGALAAGYIVVVDRYKYSNAVYQSILVEPGRSVYSVERILSLNEIVPPAHILVYLDADPEVALERIRGSRARLEMPETLETLERVRRAYGELLDALEARPEWPRSEFEPPLWAMKLTRITGLDYTCLYPPRGPRAPLVIRVDANKPLEEVALQAARRTLETVIETGLMHVNRSTRPGPRG